MSKFIQRRRLMKTSLFSFLFLSMPGFIFSRISMATAKKPMLDMKSKDAKLTGAINIAKGLGYVEDANKAEKAGKLKRKKVEGVKPETIDCGSCNFYKVTEKGKSGECTLIQGVLVHEKGYCNSWVKKAGT